VKDQDVRIEAVSSRSGACWVARLIIEEAVVESAVGMKPAEARRNLAKRIQHWSRAAWAAA
jgi:hypothetical protein